MNACPTPAPRASSIRAAQLLLLAALLHTGAALASFGKDYDTAILRIEKRDYAAAIPLLERVIEDVPASQPRIRLYGMRFAPYTPHYWLGVAHHGLGDCGAALTHWQNEARFEVISGARATAMGRDVEQCTRAVLEAGLSLPEDATQLPPEDETVGTPDPALRELAERYLRGDYAGVAAFDPQSLSGPSDRAHAWIYRAAAEYVLHVLSGSERDPVTAVRDSLAQARAIGTEPEIERRRFPPKFLQLMDAERTSP